MELIIGGSYQGKKEYAQNTHGNIQWVDGSDCTWEQLCQAQGVYNFQEYVKGTMQRGKSTQHLAEELIEANPQLVVVSTEVGYGVVPMDAFQREYREAVGRVCIKLASFSSKVTRVVCGIGTVIKDA